MVIEYIYLDIENVYNKVATLGPYLSVERDQSNLCQLKVQMVHIAPYIENAWPIYLL